MPNVQVFLKYATSGSQFYNAYYNKTDPNSIESQTNITNIASVDTISIQNMNLVGTLKTMPSGTWNDLSQANDGGGSGSFEWDDDNDSHKPSMHSNTDDTVFIFTLPDPEDGHYWTLLTPHYWRDYHGSSWNNTIWYLHDHTPDHESGSVTPNTELVGEDRRIWWPSSANNFQRIYFERRVKTFTWDWYFDNGSATGHTPATSGTYNYNTEIKFPTSITRSGWIRTGGTIGGNKYLTTNDSETYTWRRPSYYISYDKNTTDSITGDLPGPHDDDYNDSSVTITISTQTIARSGYLFLGWSRNASASAAETTFTFWDDVPTTDYTDVTKLYAVWSSSVSVTFNRRVGEGGMLPNPVTQVIESSTLPDNNLELSYYTGIGWTENDSNIEGEEYNYIAGESVQLYGKFRKNILYIDYKKWNDEVNGDELLNVPVEYNTNHIAFNNNVDYYASPTHTKEYHTFIGFVTLENMLYRLGYVAFDTSGGVPFPDLIVNHDNFVTLYSVFRKNKFVIHLKKRPGSDEVGTESTVNIDYNPAGLYILPPFTFTKPNYFQVGWEDASGTTLFLDNNDLLNNDSIHVVYAKWFDTAFHTIQYDKNTGIGGTLPDSLTYEYTISQIIILQDISELSNNPTKNRHLFKGYSEIGHNLIEVSPSDIINHKASSLGSYHTHPARLTYLTVNRWTTFIQQQGYSFVLYSSIEHIFNRQNYNNYSRPFKTYNEDVFYKQFKYTWYNGSYYETMYSWYNYEENRINGTYDANGLYVGDYSVADTKRDVYTYTSIVHCSIANPYTSGPDSTMPTYESHSIQNISDGPGHTENYKGEWIMFELTHPKKISYLQIISITNIGLPKKYKLYAKKEISDDWTTVLTEENAYIFLSNVFSNKEGVSQRQAYVHNTDHIQYSDDTTLYTYFVLCVNKIINDGTQEQALTIDMIKLFEISDIPVHQNKITIWEEIPTSDQTTTLYAIWEPEDIQYTIEYQHGLTGYVESKPNTSFNNKDGTVTLSDDVYLPRRRVQTKWKISLQDYSMGQTISGDDFHDFLDTILTGVTITATAVFRPIQIIFKHEQNTVLLELYRKDVIITGDLTDPNDGKLSSIDIQDINRNLPQKPSHIFVSWNTVRTTATSSTDIDISNAFDDMNDVILYPRYVQQLTLDYNYDVPPYTQQLTPYLDPVTSTYKYNLPEITRTGYDFLEWCVNRNGVGDTYIGEQDIGQFNAINTLYAKWNAVQYTLTYKSNEGPVDDTINTGPTEKELKFTIENFGASSYYYLEIDTDDGTQYVKLETTNLFEKPGETQTGWLVTHNDITVNDDNVSLDQAEVRFQFQYSSVNIYPVWRINEYKITYKLGTQNTFLQQSDDDYDYDIYLPKVQTYYYSDIFSSVEPELVLKPLYIEYKGFRAIGWSKKDGINDLVDISIDFKNSGETDVVGDIILYVAWEKIEYKIINLYDYEAIYSTIYRSLYFYPFSKRLNHMIRFSTNVGGIFLEYNNSGVILDDTNSVEYISQINEITLNRAYDFFYEDEPMPHIQSLSSLQNIHKKSSLIELTDVVFIKHKPIIVKDSSDVTLTGQQIGNTNDLCYKFTNDGTFKIENKCICEILLVGGGGGGGNGTSHDSGGGGGGGAVVHIPYKVMDSGVYNIIVGNGGNNNANGNDSSIIGPGINIIAKGGGKGGSNGSGDSGGSGGGASSLQLDHPTRYGGNEGVKSENSEIYTYQNSGYTNTIVTNVGGGGGGAGFYSVGNGGGGGIQININNDKHYYGGGGGGGNKDSAGGNGGNGGGGNGGGAGINGEAGEDNIGGGGGGGGYGNTTGGTGGSGLVIIKIKEGYNINHLNENLFKVGLIQEYYSETSSEVNGLIQIVDTVKVEAFASFNTEQFRCYGYFKALNSKYHKFKIVTGGTYEFKLGFDTNNIHLTTGHLEAEIYLENGVFYPIFIEFSESTASTFNIMYSLLEPIEPGMIASSPSWSELTNPESASSSLPFLFHLKTFPGTTSMRTLKTV